MAKRRTFSGCWKMWMPIVVGLILMVGSGVLVLQGFETSEPVVPEEVTEDSQDSLDQEIESTAPIEAEHEDTTGVHDAEKAIEVENGKPIHQDHGRIRIIYGSTYYYLVDSNYATSIKPADIGEQIGVVEDSNYPEMVGEPIYVPNWDVTWFDNHAVDGMSVPQCIYMEVDGWYYYGETFNEKTVARYTAADVQAAIDRGDDQWILDTFVVPVEMFGPIRFSDSAFLEADQLVRLFLASTHLNTGTQVKAWQMRDHGWSIPFEDLEWRLSRFLDDFTFDPNQLREYQLGTQDGEPVHVFVWQDDTEPQPIDGLYLKYAGLEDDLLYLRVGLPETDDLYDEVGYMIRFDADSWRYLSIETPG